MKNRESFESKLYKEENIENIEEEKKEKDEIPWNTKIIFQRHSEFNSESSNECYWRMEVIGGGEGRGKLIKFLIEKGIINEENREEIIGAEFIEDELIKIVDEGKLLNSLEEKDFLDFLVEVGFAKNQKEAKESFEDYINNNKKFNEIKKESDNGSLTENGKELTKKATLERLEEITEDKTPTDIIFYHSNTQWLDWRDKNGLVKGFGSRGKETTEEILKTISSEVENGTELGKKIEENIRILGVNSSEDITESDIFYIFHAPNPRAYIKALREKYSEKDWWEAYYNIAQEFEDLRKRTGAEGPKDLARRVESVIKLAKLYDDQIKREKLNRNLVVWVVSHKELIRSFIQHTLKAEGEDIENYDPDFNEGVDIFINHDGTITAKLENGKEYPVEGYFKSGMDSGKIYPGLKQEF